MKDLNPLEIGWIAGLLEGEGCFYFRALPRSDGSTYPAAVAQCNMTDKDVIERLHSLVGGKMRGPIEKYTQTGTLGKPQWLWTLGRTQGLEDFLRIILPHMGIRRTEKINYILNEFGKSPPRPGWRHGRWGYEKYGCKCAICREAHNKHHRDQRARKNAK